MLRVYESSTGLGNNVQWQLSQENRNTAPTIEGSCAVSSSAYEPCERREPESVLHFLLQNVNSTLHRKTQPAVSALLPLIMYAEFQSYSYPAFILHTGEKWQFRFITSDGLKEDSVSLGNLASPFKLKLWACFGAAIMILALLLTGLSGFNFHSCALHLFGLLSTLVDQPVQFRNQTRAPVSSVMAHRITMGSWLLSILVTRMVYKAMLKSTYMLEPKYETELEYLKDLQGFTLYFFHTYEPDSVQPWVAKSLKSWLLSCVDGREKRRGQYGPATSQMDCETQYYKSKCVYTVNAYQEETGGLTICSVMRSHSASYDEDYQRKCKHATNFDSMNTENNWKDFYEDKDVYLCEIRILTENLLRHVRVREETELETILLNGLTAPKTALVIPQRSFDRVWEQVRGVMKKTRKKLASNANTKDDPVLGLSPTYKISSDFGIYGDVLQIRRAKVLMESGLYRLWKRWDKLRGARKSTQGISEKYSDFIPLSLKNSDFMIVFHLYTCCLCFVFASLLIECRFLGRSFISWLARF